MVAYGYQEPLSFLLRCLRQSILMAGVKDRGQRMEGVEREQTRLILEQKTLMGA